MALWRYYITVQSHGYNWPTVILLEQSRTGGGDWAEIAGSRCWGLFFFASKIQPKQSLIHLKWVTMNQMGLYHSVRITRRDSHCSQNHHHHHPDSVWAARSEQIPPLPPYWLTAYYTGGSRDQFCQFFCTLLCSVSLIGWPPISSSSSSSVPWPRPNWPPLSCPAGTIVQVNSGVAMDA